MVKCVTLAGLCHNIGHGPYSYPFTDFVHSTLNIKDWDHTSAAIMLIDDIIDKNAIDIHKDEINLIKDLILGENINSSFSHKWLFQILRNKTNGVDVDKFDFIRRDTYQYGIHNQSFEFKVLLNSARVIEDEICYSEKNNIPFSINELFLCRYRLFKEFYLHRVSKGIDLMIMDIFSESNSVFKFSECLYNPLRYGMLNDSILKTIHSSKNVGLHKAKQIVDRIYKRDLYKYVGELITHPDGKNFDRYANLTEDDILNYSSSDFQLERGDVKILKLKMNFGKDKEDPSKCVKFYTVNKNGYKINHDFDINNQSHIKPSVFEEIKIIVYVRDQSKLTAAQNALRKYTEEKSGTSPKYYEKNPTRLNKSACKSTKKKLSNSLLDN